MIFRNTDGIRLSLIHEGEAAGGRRVPNIRRKHIQNSSHPRHEPRLYFSLLTFRTVGARRPDADLRIHDLTQLMFALPQCFLGALSLSNIAPHGVNSPAVRRGVPRYPMI